MLATPVLAVNRAPEPPVVSTPGEVIVLDHEGRGRGTRVQFDDIWGPWDSGTKREQRSWETGNTPVSSN